MPTTKQDIEMWLIRAKSLKATHLIVAMDTFDYDDYPVYVMKGENVHQREKEIQSSSMQRVMEVYYVAGNWNEQLNRGRCFEYDPN